MVAVNAMCMVASCSFFGTSDFNCKAKNQVTKSKSWVDELSSYKEIYEKIGSPKDACSWIKWLSIDPDTRVKIANNAFNEFKEHGGRYMPEYILADEVQSFCVDSGLIRTSSGLDPRKLVNCPYRGNLFVDKNSNLLDLRGRPSSLFGTDLDKSLMQRGCNVYASRDLYIQLSRLQVYLWNFVNKYHISCDFLATWYFYYSPYAR